MDERGEEFFDDKDKDQEYEHQVMLEIESLSFKDAVVWVSEMFFMHDNVALIEQFVRDDIGFEELHEGLENSIERYSIALAEERAQEKVHG